MDKELVIDVRKEQVSIALLEDKSLVELNRDALTQTLAVGNIYMWLGKKIMQGLNAAFVDIGYEKEAFIHYHDLGFQFLTFNNYIQQILNDRKHEPKIKRQPDLDKEGNISSVLQVGQMIMVQIVKEPINTKGPRLTAEISIAGRNMVLLPLGEKVSVSQKIRSNEERVRLRRLLQSIKPANRCIIFRTLAEGKRLAELDAELKVMFKRWDKRLAYIRKSKGSDLLQVASGRSSTIVSVLFSPYFEADYVHY